MIGGVEQRLPGLDVPNPVIVDDFGPVDAESGEAEPKSQGAPDLLSFKDRRHPGSEVAHQGSVRWVA